jgi:hypothetical protein
MRYSLIAALALMSACGSAPEAETARSDAPGVSDITAIADEAAPPRLPQPSEIGSKIINIVGLTDNGLPFAPRDDEFTGGQHLSGDYDNGRIDFYTMPDGGTWKVRVTSGTGSNCGFALSGPQAVDRLIETVTPEVHKDIIAKELVKAFAKGTIEQIEKGTLRYSASGGCVQSFTVTQMDALPLDKRL